MNTATLKQVLSIVAHNINAKAKVEAEAARNAYALRWDKLSEEVTAARNAALAKAFNKIKGAPTAKAVSIAWISEPTTSNGGYNHNLFQARLTPWAEEELIQARNLRQDALDSCRKTGESVNLKFVYGTGSDDYVVATVPQAREASYRALRAQFDAMRVKLLLSDNTEVATAVASFLAVLEKL